MATEIEYEKTYLLRQLPEDIEKVPYVTIRDTYIPDTADHAHLRLRAKDNSYVITKKNPVAGTDSSVQYEHTIELTKEEYDALVTCSKKTAVKRRYVMQVAGRTAEIDLYGEELSGLVVIDFEFSSETEKDVFEMPDICLVDVTQDETVAGGYLPGRSYEDIEPALRKYGYERISL